MRLAVLAILLAACEPLPFVRDELGHMAKLDKQPASWGFSCDFPEADKDTVRHAFEFWNAKASVFVETVDCVTPDDVTSYFMTVVEASEETHGGTVTLSYGSPKIKPSDSAVTARRIADGSRILGARITFYRHWLWNETRQEQENTARHEIGHVLGFDDNQVSTCLMSGERDDWFNRDHPKELCREEHRDFMLVYGGL